ncbi:hypothetical protein M3090_01085 [Bacteroides sp. ET71]|uniref:hypothetical protein n=1 Tax=Bacteroides sp. ET71 TaxID=2939421 RepID=UPI002013B420|nr:hypothetical protein [Bacteroides sp. ET71]MCL1615005.1 hypothetical protein [Bacteroides sp. ET71]
MKKRVLFSACALAACFTACTNDDFQSAMEGNQNVATEIGETVGADLVSKGMTITVQDGEADTRMGASGNFTNGDIIGLAAYNLNEEGKYGNTQNQSDWSSSNANQDKKIYNIPSFETEDNGATWTTMANIYQGPYFAYYPWSRKGFQEEMVVTPNEPAQTGAFASDRYTNRFQLSAQDFIASGAGVTADGALAWDFCLVSPLNQYAVVPAPNAYITASDYLKAMYITSMTVNTNAQGGVIATKATINPHLIPHVVRTMYGDIDTEATREAMDKAAVLTTDNSSPYLIVSDWATSVTTSMGDSKYFTLAGGENLHQIRVFSFPIKQALSWFNGVAYSPDVVFVVKGNQGTWKLGEFKVDADQADSQTLIENLKKLYGNNAEWSMTKILRNQQTGAPKALVSAKSMSAVLTPQNFTPATDNITEVAQWNDLVNLIDALTGEGGKYKAGQEVTFTLGGNLSFTGNIATPKNGVKIELVTNSNSLTINGTSEWPENLIADKADNIVVAADAVLKVGAAGTATAGKKIELDATITNNGTIYAGALASISTQDSKALDNTDGTVFVEFGAYVYPSGDATVGEIAFEVKDSEQETMGNINTLIQTDNTKFADQNEYAYVNTLYIGTEEAQVTLDLNAKAKDEDPGDRYETATTPAQYLLPLDLIDIVLVNGKVVYKKGDANDNVKNVISRSGKNEIRDVIPLGNITVEEGSVLTIESDEVYGTYSNEDKDLVLPAEDATITNYGTLNVTTSVETVDINNMNYDTSVINVDPDEHIWYSGTYVQDGQTKGDIVRNPKVPIPSLSAEAHAVIDAYEECVKADDIDTSSEEKFLESLMSYVKRPGALDTWVSVKFYNAFKNWYKAQYGVSLSGTVGNDAQDITSLMLKNFEKDGALGQWNFSYE